MRRLLADALQDLVIAVRQIRRRPGWALATTVVLALGIGANTAMFAAFDTWVLRPLPFPEPQELTTIWESQPAAGRWRAAVSPANLHDWRERQSVFVDMGAFARSHFNLDDESEPVRLDGCRIDSSLFPLLGVEPILGRNFTEDEDRPGQPAAVVLLGHRLWQERYGRDPEILGRPVRVDGRVHEVVGVMPESFAFPEWAEVWLPLAADADGTPRESRYLTVIGRVRDDISRRQAEARLQEISRSLEVLHPESNRGWTVRLESLKESWLPDVVRVALTASLGAAVLVLVIICATVAGLFVAQAASRARELAVRTALGAGRGRLVRQLVTESTLLAVVAGVLGALLGIVWLDWMVSRAPIDPPYMFRMEVDASALLWTVGAALLAGVLCSVAPILQVSRGSVEEALGTGGRTGGASSASARLRAVLVVTELALSTALAVGAFLMVKSFLVQQRVEHGYRTDGVFTTELSLRGSGLESADDRLAFIDRLHEGLQAVSPAVGMASSLPVGDGWLPVAVEVEGRAVEEEELPRASEVSVTAGYLETLEIPIIAGRRFTAAEHRQGGDVTVVSKELAARLWGTTDVVGRRLRTEAGESGPWLSVVGVIGDVAAVRDMVQPDAPQRGHLYRPYSTAPVTQLNLVMQSERPPDELAVMVRQALRGAGVAVPVSEVLTMREAMRRARWVTAYFSEQLAMYAIIALFIASLGIYGLVAESVAQRHREMAIRFAMGADRGRVVGLVVGQGARLALAGIALGLLLGLPVARSARSMLAGVSPADPLIIGAVVVVLAATSLLASYLPARRAASVNPAQALRSD